VVAVESDLLSALLLDTGSLPPAVLAVVFALLMFVIIFITKLMGYFKILLNIVIFSYPNAFVVVRGNPCIQERELNRLIESGSIPEVLALLKGYGFAIDIGEYATMDEIDRGLEEYYHRECTEIEHIVPDSVQPFFRAFCMIQETAVLKTAIRLKNADVEPEVMEGSLSPVGILSRHLLRKMVDARNVDELVRLLQSTVYGPPLAVALPDAAMEQTTLPFERALDRFVGEQLQSSLSLIDALQTPPLFDFVMCYFDITNIKILLRGLRDGLGMEVLVQDFLPAGYHITHDALKRMAETRSIQDIPAHLQNTPYGSAFESAMVLYEKSGSLQPFEAALDRVLLDSVYKLSLVYSFGPATVVRYLIAKQFELQNVRAIVWGIQNRNPPETMRAMVVRQGGAA
jgi:V/A-type H+-transporting ATPase subunit C